MVKSSKAQEINPSILVAFVGIVLIGWLLKLIPSLVAAAQQWSSNPNLSAYYTTFLYDLFLPLIVFGIFLAYKRRKAGMPLVVESMFLTLIVWIVATTVSSLSQFFINQLHIVLAGDLGWWYFELVACAASSVATFGVLLYARRLGKW